MVEQDTSNILIKVRIFDRNLLIYSIIFLLLSNSFNDENRSVLYSRCAIITLVYCLIIGLQLGISDFHNIYGIYGGLFNVTNITHTFQMFIFIVTIVVLLLTGFYPRNLNVSKLGPNITSDILLEWKEYILNREAEQYKMKEYPILLLFIIMGGIFLISSSDIVSLFISIELQSYGLYLLSAAYRNSELASSASLMYFLLGGFSSCVILLGTGLLYVNSGSTSLNNYYVIISISNTIQEAESNIENFYNIDTLNMSLLIICLGFLFKISAAPFHFWTPDVYDAVPTIVATFIAVVTKISILVFMLELVHFSVNNNIYYDNWTYNLFVCSFLSLIFGSVLGIKEKRIKRILAYSTVSNIGFILLSLSINTLESTQGFIFYLIQYSLSNLNIFLILLSIGYTVYICTYKYNDNEDDNKSKNQYDYKNMNKNVTKKENKNDEVIYNKDIKKLIDTNNSPIQLIDQLKGYFFINPFLALSLTITLFSLVGVPPLMGFFGKQMILSAALDSGYIFLPIIAILTSVISAVYYLNFIKEMFFKNAVGELYKKTEIRVSYYFSFGGLKIYQPFMINAKNTVLSSTLTISISILTLTILLFATCSQEVLNLCYILAITLCSG